jgi:hypothetical protein
MYHLHGSQNIFLKSEAHFGNSYVSSKVVINIIGQNYEPIIPNLCIHICYDMTSSDNNLDLSSY